MHVRQAAVVGAGTMGAAIAELLAYNGIEVLLKDLDETKVQRGLDHAGRVVRELVQFQAGRAGIEAERLRSWGVELLPGQRNALDEHLAPKFTHERGHEVLNRIHGTTSYEGFAKVDLVIEAVFEHAEIKRTVLREIDAHVPPSVIMGSNTSSLSITALANGLRHPDRVLVTHFFNPPATLPLVEIAAGIETREGVVEETLEFLQELRNHRYPLVPIRVKESPAFVVNRLLIPVLTEACFALAEGIASARDIDLAMKTGAGLPMGPFELADLIGLDVALEVAETLQRETGDPKYRPSPVLRRLVAAGHLGRKTGRGFYEYV
jgi:3-hydroxybutyryl-CoA dehydrogenase